MNPDWAAKNWLSTHPLSPNLHKIMSRDPPTLRREARGCEVGYWRRRCCTRPVRYLLQKGRGLRQAIQALLSVDKHFFFGNGDGRSWPTALFRKFTTLPNYRPCNSFPFSSQDHREPHSACIGREALRDHFLVNLKRPVVLARARGKGDAKSPATYSHTFTAAYTGKIILV
jgi:hypothetical protein